MESKDKGHPTHFNPSTLENIDASLFEYVDQKLNLHTVTNSGFTKVPVLWVGAERANQIKKNVDIRNKDGLLNLPLIAIERTSVTKDASKKGIVPANLPDSALSGMIPAFTVINDEKTRVFRRSRNLKKFGADSDVGAGKQDHPDPRQLKTPVAPMFDTRPSHLKEGDKTTVYKTYYMPIPVYIDVKYEITIQTQYQQQMNDLLTPWISGFSEIGRNHRYFLLRREGHLYEAFIDGSFSTDNNVSTLQEEERKFTSRITIEVLGYLVGSDKNEHQNEYKAYENRVDIKFPRERVIVGDIPERVNLSGKKPFYKE